MIIERLLQCMIVADNNEKLYVYMCIVTFVY